MSSLKTSETSEPAGSGLTGHLRLVVDGRVESELAQELAGDGVDDADLEVGGEQDDVGSGVGSADADVVQPPVMAQGDDAGVVDPVVADPGVGVAVAAGGRERFRERVIDRGRGARWGSERCGRRMLYSPAKASSRAWSWPTVGGCAGWARSQFFIVCWNRSTLPQVVGWFGREFFWMTCSRRSSASKALRPPLPPARRVVKTMPLSVSVAAGTPCAATAARKVASTIGPLTRGCAVTDSA